MLFLYIQRNTVLLYYFDIFCIGPYPIAKGRPSNVLPCCFVDVSRVSPFLPTTSSPDSIIVLRSNLEKSWLLCYRNKTARTLRVPLKGTTIWFYIYKTSTFPLPLPVCLPISLFLEQLRGFRPFLSKMNELHLWRVENLMSKSCSSGSQLYEHIHTKLVSFNV